jgi:hypothetical protein
MGFQARRSSRVAISVPIRVYGIDYRGVDFSEDSLTLVVNLHGAKIRLAHQLLPESEIRLFSYPTGSDSVFRVVSKLQTPELLYTYWGIENLHPEKNIWGVDIPEVEPGDQPRLLVELTCPSCSARERMHAGEVFLASLQERGGVEHTCAACKKTGVWKLPSAPPT